MGVVEALYIFDEHKYNLQPVYDQITHTTTVILFFNMSIPVVRLLRLP